MVTETEVVVAEDVMTEKVAKDVQVQKADLETEVTEEILEVTQVDEVTEEAVKAGLQDQDVQHLIPNQLVPVQIDQDVQVVQILNQVIQISRELDVQDDKTQTSLLISKRFVNFKSK